MLTFHTSVGTEGVEVDIAAEAIPPEVQWIDAFRPNRMETAFLERILGIETPTIESLSSIETSSRLYVENDRIFLSMSMVYKDVGGMAETTPFGFVLSENLLLTVRFHPIRACDHVHDKAIHTNRRPASGVNAFVSLLEFFIDHVADQLEGLNGELDRLSHDIFGGKGARGVSGQRGGGGNKDLRLIMRRIGRSGDLTSKLDDALLGMGRIIPFVVSEGAAWLSADLISKLKSMQRDITSLNDYETHQNNKLQFLLDATLGLTNIEQNNIFRILTVVSVVGIPPTLMASIYGMNFKNMPELEWHYGYAYGLGVIAISALIPIIWFKVRGWW
jgi:magnesium transporter